jgi:hypothetical protein
MPTVKPFSMPTKQLAVAISSSATSFQLSDINGWDGQPVSSANFGTIAFAVFRNSANTVLEIVQIDPSTVASSAITITTRGLDFNGGTTNVPANALNWPANDTLVDLGSDPAQLFAQYANLNLPATITALWGFTVSPTAPVGGTGNQVATATDIANAVSGASGTATTSVYGTVKTTTSTNTVVSTNDSRVPTTNQAAALVADNTDVAVGSGNKYVSQTGLQHSAETYAADSSGAANTITATLSPVPTSYTAGMTVSIKVANATTGATTINLNSLGAKTVKKYVAGALTDLAANDLLAGQTATFGYDGTYFILQSPTAMTPAATPVYKSGVSSYSAVSGSQTIAHGLGAMPKYVRITAKAVKASSTYPTVSTSNGFYNGSAVSNLSVGYSGTTQLVESAGTTYIVDTTAGGNALSGYTATITVDATNINLTWTKMNSADPVSFLWEAST